MNEVTTKYCKDCQKDLPLDEFYIRNKVTGSRFCLCKRCRANRQGHVYFKDRVITCRTCKSIGIPSNYQFQYYCSTQCRDKWEQNKWKLRSPEFKNQYKKDFFDKKLWMTEEPSSEYLNKDGYIVCVYRYLSIAKHRLVMMRKLGRNLHKWEHIHHINSIKDDNREDNLTVMFDKTHMAVTKVIEENKVLREKIRELESIINLANLDEVIGKGF